MNPEWLEGEQIPLSLRAKSRPTREEIIMIMQHTVPGDEAVAKDTEAGTPGDSPELALAEIGLDRSSICEILSSEPGIREDRW